jgi:PKD repeat protein
LVEIEKCDRDHETSRGQRGHAKNSYGEIVMSLLRRIARSALIAACAALAVPAAHAKGPNENADEHAVVQFQIVQSRGVDQSVNYGQLKKYGPWDDRNYRLTRKDLDYLSPNESDAIVPIPAFYRVEMRKANPNLPKTGPAQYPRVALNGFLEKYEGIEINGRHYRALRHKGGEDYEVLFEAEDESKDQFAKFLGGEKRITTPVGAAESAVAVNPVNTNLVIAGTNGPGTGQKMWRSSDGGVTWLGPTSLSGTCCDPAVGWSPDGTVGYMMALSSVVGSGTNVFFYRSTDNGATWNQSATLSNQHQSDKEYFTVDTYASSPRKGNIYTAWHDSNVQKFARSTDGGVTFGSVLTLDSASRGIGSDLTTDKNGNVYFFFPTTSGGSNAKQIRVLKSTDGGATFAAGVTVSATNADFDFPIPAMETRRAFVYVAAGTDFSSGTYGNSLYVSWTDTNTTEDNNVAANNHSVIKVAYSRDGGATWTTKIAHSSADISTVDRFNQWLSVDQNGRVFVMFYDTRNSSGRSGTDVYYTMSTDGGQTYGAATRLTTVTSRNVTDSFEWGDYNGMDMALNNIMAIYTDNRDEAGGTAQSVDVYGIGGFAPSGGNVAPTANFSFTTSALTANFTDSSTDSDGTITARSWNFGDGATSTSTNPSHTYAAAGTYTVQLTVTDNGGLANSISKQVTVSSGGGVTVSIADVAISEGNATSKSMTFKVLLSAAASGPVKYNIATSNGTAVSGSDYTAKSLSGVTITAGVLSKNFTVSIKGDTVSEPDETFNVTLSNVTGATVADGQAVGTIQNDDGATGSATLSIGDISATEGNSGTKQFVFTVSLSQAAATDVSYNIATSGGTATAGSDYVASSLAGQVIPAGQTSKTFSVTVNGDTVVETNERIRVSVTGVTGATLLDGLGIGTITNDD